MCSDSREEAPWGPSPAPACLLGARTSWIVPRVGARFPGSGLRGLRPVSPCVARRRGCFVPGPSSPRSSWWPRTPQDAHSPGPLQRHVLSLRWDTWGCRLRLLVLGLPPPPSIISSPCPRRRGSCSLAPCSGILWSPRLCPVAPAAFDSPPPPPRVTRTPTQAEPGQARDPRSLLLRGAVCNRPEAHKGSTSGQGPTPSGHPWSSGRLLPCPSLQAGSPRVCVWAPGSPGPCGGTGPAQSLAVVCRCNMLPAGRGACGAVGGGGWGPGGDCSVPASISGV